MMMGPRTTAAMNTGTAAAAETSGTTRAATTTRISRRYRRRTSDEIKPPQSRNRRQTALTAVAMPPLLLLYTSLTLLLALLPVTVEASRYAKICPLTDSKLVRIAVDPSVEGGFVLLDDEEEDNNWGSSSSSGDAESGGGRRRSSRRASLLRGGGSNSAGDAGSIASIVDNAATEGSPLSLDKEEETDNYDDEEPFLFLQLGQRRDEDTTWDAEGKTILHARECPCAPRRTYCLQPSPSDSSSDPSSSFNDDTILPADTCGVQLNDSGSTASCFTVSSRTVFVRNAWPVVVLWYGALVVFLFATDNGRNARHYVMIKVCSPSFAKLGSLLGFGDAGSRDGDDGEGRSGGRGRRSNANERRVDQIVQHEIEIRDRMRRAAALGHRRRLYLGVRQRGRRNLMMEEEEDDWEEEGEFTGTLVLKTRRFDQKKEMERRRRKLLGRQESGSLGKDAVKDTEGGGEGDEDEASRGNTNHPSSDGGGSSDDAAGASMITTPVASRRRRPSDGTPDTVPTIESPFSLSSEDDGAFSTPTSTLRSKGSFVNEEEDLAADPTTATVDGCHVKDECDHDDVNDDHDDDEDHEITCTICIGPVQDGDRVGALPCEHVFHVDCLKEWIKRKNVCPLCQEPRIASPKMRPSPTGPGEREGDGEEQQERGNGTAAAASASSTTTSGGSPDARRRREPFPLRTMRMRLFRMDGDNNDGNDNGGEPATGAAGERAPAGASINSGRGGNNAAPTGDAATNDDDDRRTSPQGGGSNALRPSPPRPPLPPSSSSSPRTPTRMVLVGRPENAAHHHHRRSRSSSSQQSGTLTRLSPSSSYGSDAV